MKKLILLVAASALAAASWWVFRDTAPAPQGQEVQLTAEQRPGYRSLKRAGLDVPLPSASSNKPGVRGRLYHPPVNFDQVSVAGKEDLYATRGVASEKVAQLIASHKRPDSRAIAAGESEKSKRRALRPKRGQRPRGWGKKSGHGNGRATSSPAQIVREKQAELESEGDER